VRDYADQKDAVDIARARLGSSGSERRSTELARIWTAVPGADFHGAVSRDGRYVPYVDWDKEGDLYLRDVVAGVNRRVTNTANYGTLKGAGQSAGGLSFSPDGKHLAYAWFKGVRDGDRYELRIVRVGNGGTPEPRRLFDNEDVHWISPDDWSRDGKWIAVQLQRKDRSAHIGLIAVQDGSLRVLRSIERRGSSSLSFSPDGKYLAFDRRSARDTAQRDVFVLAVDDGREFAAVAHPSEDALIGWSADGKLIFASDRSGSVGLWALPFAGGRPQGPAELLKTDLGHFQSMGMSEAGALYMALSDIRNRSNIETASFDFERGQFTSPRAAAVPTFVGANQHPDWSPDGRFLAYVSRRGALGGSLMFAHYVVGIQSLEGGSVRELSPSPNFQLFWSLHWAPDGRSLVVGGRDETGRNAAFRIDAQTGRTSVLVEVDEPAGFTPRLAPDGTHVYYSRHVFGPTGTRERAFVAHNLASGEARELVRRPALGNVHLSPDGRYIATASNDAAAKSLVVLLVPTSAGEQVRELMRADQSPGYGILAWAPDSRSVFLRRPTQSTHAVHEMWRAPIDGGKPAKLDSTLEASIGGFRVHPDGRRVAYQVSSPSKPAEVWVLRNFLPKRSGTN